MIDLHCHLLPGVDDGPKTLDEAIAMARLAYQNGITRAQVTPHIHPGRYENDVHSIRQALNIFSKVLVEHDIPLRLGMAAEVRISPEIMPMAEQGILPYLGDLDGYKLLLLEFPHSHIPAGSQKLVRWLLARNVRPVIAHPERNKDVIYNFDKIIPFVREGCLLQVTASAVAGAFGPFAQERSRQLLERGWVTILASDAHNLDVRPPDLETGRAAAELIVGKQASWALVRDTPATLLGRQLAA